MNVETRIVATEPPMVALVGNPNAGKSTLFNVLTGARQKVGNYPGVTVERHAGRLIMADGRPVELVDLPGTYSLTPSSPDEQVTCDTVMGQQAGERVPAVLVVVVDSANLDNHLRFATSIDSTVNRAAGSGRPVIRTTFLPRPLPSATASRSTCPRWRKRWASRWSRPLPSGSEGLMS